MDEELLAAGGPYRSTFVKRPRRSFRRLAVFGCVIAAIQVALMGASIGTLPWDGAVLIGVTVIALGFMRIWVAWTGDNGLATLSWLTLASDGVLASFACLHVWVLEHASLMQSVSGSLLAVAALDALLGLAMLRAASTPIPSKLARP